MGFPVRLRRVLTRLSPASYHFQSLRTRILGDSYARGMPLCYRASAGRPPCLIALRYDQNPVEWLPSRKHRLQRGRQNQDRLKLLTARFRNALKKSVEGIIEAGRVLIEAKNELEHGQFMDWVVRDLRFGTTRGDREPGPAQGTNAHVSGEE